MRFSATIITCNAELLIGKLLAHIIPLFDRVIVIDGPSAPGPGQAGGDGRLLTNGIPRSTDRTIQIVKSFGNAVTLITNHRPWNGKTEKFNRALQFTDPGYIWEFDYDEFYHREHIYSLQSTLRQNPEITDVEFWAYHFWGSADYHTPIDHGQWGNDPPWRRVFKYTGTEKWESHEPPRMARGEEVVLDRDTTRDAGIMMYHYSYCTEFQFRQKEKFYGASFIDEYHKWKSGTLQKNLVKFSGQHPVDVTRLL